MQKLTFFQTAVTYAYRIASISALPLAIYGAVALEAHWVFKVVAGVAIWAGMACASGFIAEAAGLDLQVVSMEEEPGYQDKRQKG